MNGSAESIIAKVAGMSIRISAGVGVAGGEVWRLPDLARLLDPPVQCKVCVVSLSLCLCARVCVCFAFLVWVCVCVCGYVVFFFTVYL